MEKLKCTVKMLPSEKATTMFLYHKTKQLMHRSRKLSTIFGENAELATNQHLYFLAQPTAEQRKQGIGVIKEGDWFIRDGKTGRAKQIIETDDNGKSYDNLKYINSHGFGKIVATTDPSLGLPLIPQSFVEKYVEKQEKIDDVMIELADTNGLEGGPVNKKRLNGLYVRMDNTVICSPVKDSWTERELWDHMQYYMEYCHSNGYVTPQDWIENHKHF